MSKWMEFTEDYDHRWPSGAVTAFKEGMIVNVKNEVAEGATEAGAAKSSKKPDKEEAGYRSTPSREESHRQPGDRILKPVKTGGHIPGNPFTPALLPDAADPNAVRSEPMVEVDRAAAAGEPVEETEDHESESQIEPVKE